MCLISLKALMSLKSITENTHIISNYVILNILKLFTCLIAPLNVCLFNKIEENNFVVCFYTTNRHSCVSWCAQKRIISSSLACGQQQLIIYVQRIYDIKLIIFYSFFTLVHQKTCIGNQIRNKKNRFIAWHRNGEAIHMTACYE